MLLPEKPDQMLRRHGGLLRRFPETIFFPTMFFQITPRPLARPLTICFIRPGFSHPDIFLKQRQSKNTEHLLPFFPAPGSNT